MESFEKSLPDKDVFVLSSRFSASMQVILLVCLIISDISSRVLNGRWDHFRYGNSAVLNVTFASD